MATVDRAPLDSPKRLRKTKNLPLISMVCICCSTNFLPERPRIPDSAFFKVKLAPRLISIFGTSPLLMCGVWIQLPYSLLSELFFVVSSLLFTWSLLLHYSKLPTVVPFFFVAKQKKQDTANVVGNTKASEDELTCTVCLEQVTVGELVRSLPCLHQVYFLSWNVCCYLSLSPFGEWFWGSKANCFLPSVNLNLVFWQMFEVLFST